MYLELTRATASCNNLHNAVAKEIKMEKVIVSFEVQKPSIDDYNNQYSNMPCNSVRKENIFQIITNPTNICRALQFSDSTGSSPVAFYEKVLQSMIDTEELDELNWNEKQFVGASTCVVMQSNGWKKTGKKQRFSKGMFKSAELYKK